MDVTLCSVPGEYSLGGWEKFSVEKGFDPDTVCIDISFGGPDWGCHDESICIAAYGCSLYSHCDNIFVIHKK